MGKHTITSYSRYDTHRIQRQIATSTDGGATWPGTIGKRLVGSSYHGVADHRQAAQVISTAAKYVLRPPDHLNSFTLHSRLLSVQMAPPYYGAAEMQDHSFQQVARPSLRCHPFHPAPSSPQTRRTTPFFTPLRGRSSTCQLTAGKASPRSVLLVHRPHRSRSS